MMIFKPVDEVLGEQTDCPPAALDGRHRVVSDVSSGSEHSVALRLDQVDQTAPMGLLVLQTTAEEHVVVHVLPDTLVTVERVEVPASMEPDSQAVNGHAEHDQQSKAAERHQHARGHRYLRVRVIFSPVCFDTHGRRIHRQNT